MRNLDRIVGFRLVLDWTSYGCCAAIQGVNQSKEDLSPSLLFKSIKEGVLLKGGRHQEFGSCDMQPTRHW